MPPSKNASTSANRASAIVGFVGFVGFVGITIGRDGTGAGALQGALAPGALA